MGSFRLTTYTFDKYGQQVVAAESLGKDWPVVYLIHNNKEMYIGETQNAAQRFEQHLKNPQRKDLKSVKIIFDKEFNKSAILDIEQSLIQLCSADNKFKLQNLNGGQSEKHNYFQRDKYLSKVDEIWEKMCGLGLADNPIDIVRNTDLFKFSPYNTLTSEQNEVSKAVIYDIIKKLPTGEKGVSVINGCAGTGKTILLINIIYKLMSINKLNIDFTNDEEASLSDNIQMLHDLKVFLEELGRDIKIGYVVPMTSIRKTISKVFATAKNGLKASMVIGPLEVFKGEYDILFVDESHRLSQYKNIGYRGTYKAAAQKLGKNPNDVTELDMILAKSKYTVLVYDKNQTVKKSDITNEQFEKALKPISNKRFYLTAQMRCKGGLLFTDYIENIINCTQTKKLSSENYDFKIFDDVNEMVHRIRKLDKEIGLCRNAAGYSWEWISKGAKSFDEVINNKLEDIDIEGHKFVWNMTNQEFIISKNAVNEIGCVHTLQGYDLNYIGLIFGREIDYDPNTNRLVIDPSLFFDKYVKLGTTPEELRNFIINSYKVMLTRGIKGCYVYAYNKNLRDYLKRFIDKGDKCNG